MSKTLRASGLLGSNVSVWAFAGALLVGCGGDSKPAESPATEAPPEPTAEPTATAEPAPEPAPPAEPPAPETTQQPTEGAAEGGRLAFITCEDPRKSMCTKEYRPVCGEVDTGIRCIKAPCPSTEKKTYPNGCEACADPKVVGYFPMACDAMQSDKAP